MIQNTLHTANGIAIYGVVSVVLFFVVFAGAIVWALLEKKAFLTTMESLPLVDGECQRDGKGGVRHE